VKKIILFAIAGMFIALAQGCSSSSGGGGSSNRFPQITPPIEAATPAGLKSAFMDAVRLAGPMTLNASFVNPFSGSLSISQFETDFFQTGPTVLFNITTNVDNRMAFFNGQTSSNCLTSTPVPYTITPAGQAGPVTMYAQCYTQITSGFTGDPGLIMVGQNNGITYIWDANGAAWTAAIAKPDGNSYDVHAWYSVGIGNGVSGSGAGQCGTSWDGCSYGVAEVSSTASTGAFEMTAAGIGVGYCGVQFASDGTNTYGIGSVDGGGSCEAQATLCLLSSNESTTASGGICTAATPFSVTTAIGTIGGTANSVTWGTSTYPASANVTLNGTATDSVHFGPTTPPAGVTSF